MRFLEFLKSRRTQVMAIATGVVMVVTALAPGFPGETLLSALGALLGV